MSTFSGRPALRLFVFLILVTSLQTVPAHANGIDKIIGSGEPVSGTVAGKGLDIYKITIGDGYLSIKLDGQSSPAPDLIAARTNDASALASISLAAGSISGPAKVTVYTPSGDYAGHLTCPDSCILNLSATANGVWTLVVTSQRQHEAAGAANYTLSVNEQG